MIHDARTTTRVDGEVGFTLLKVGACVDKGADGTSLISRSPAAGAQPSLFASEAHMFRRKPAAMAALAAGAVALPARAQANIYGVNSRPVSYTHLDVYKRQQSMLVKSLNYLSA